MPAKSEKQRKFMGIVKGIQNGEVPKSYSKSAAKVAKNMKSDDVDDYIKNEFSLSTLFSECLKDFKSSV